MQCNSTLLRCQSEIEFVFILGGETDWMYFVPTCYGRIPFLAAFSPEKQPDFEIRVRTRRNKLLCSSYGAVTMLAVSCIDHLVMLNTDLTLVPYP